MSRDERDYLSYLVGELAEVVAPNPVAEDADPLATLVGITVADRPQDPGVLRLFPDGYADAEAAAEFRRYTEQGLRESKYAAAAVVRESLAGEAEPLVLTPGQADAWISALNDLRLLLGTRIGVSQDPEQFAELDDDDPMAKMVATYEFLGWMQATLLHARFGLDA